ncbi:MAG: ATP-binding protein [Desulfobacteraceae bacterium]|jgi:PAS domain S-box-containing protein
MSKKPTYEDLEKRVLELEKAELERQRAQEALRYSEHKYRRLFELESDALFLIDKASGRILEVNRAASEMYGYTRKELLKLRNTDLSVQPASTTRATQEELSVVPVRYHIKKDGTVFPVEITASHLDWHGHKAHIAAIRDITERIRIKERLLQAQKMEAIGTFAGGIAHDFNNMLSVIFGYTELALDKTDKDSQVYKDLQNLFHASMRARDLVMQILTFSRQAEQKMQPVQVNLILKEALKFLRSSLPSSIQIRSHITCDGKVVADPTQIHQVLMNLSSNAMHAMRHNGGVLEVSLDEVHLDANDAAFHPETAAGPYMKLTVADNGEGMSPEMIEDIFDPFFTTKGKEEGTGLGLAVVHGIVKSCDGFIRISSEPGEGSIFNVFLPLIEARLKPPDEIKGPLPTGTERILLVDDDKILVDIGQQMLERLGYRVTTRTSSIEALELFKAKPDRFDLVISDLTMPNMNGDKLATELISLRPVIPIIICTGFSRMISENRVKTMGVKGLLLKPIAKTDIALMVRKVLDDAKALKIEIN